MPNCWSRRPGATSWCLEALVSCISFGGFCSGHQTVMHSPLDPLPRIGRAWALLMGCSFAVVGVYRVWSPFFIDQAAQQRSFSWGHWMSNNALVAALMRVEIFQGLHAKQFAVLARHAERVVFKADDVITEVGSPGDAAYLIVGGPAVRVGGAVDGHEISDVPAGALVGEMAMLIEHDYGSLVVARGTVRALRITRVGLHEQMLADPLLAEHLMMRIARRLSTVAEELRQIDQALSAEPFLPLAETALAAIAGPAADPGSPFMH